MARKQKHVFLALGWCDFRLHEGIAKYAAEHGWHLCPNTTKEEVSPRESFDAAGGIESA